MPWKEAYTISDEITMKDEDIKWPDNNRCAVRIVVDYTVSAAGDGIGNKDIQWHLACTESGWRSGAYWIF